MNHRSIIALALVTVLHFGNLAAGGAHYQNSSVRAAGFTNKATNVPQSPAKFALLVGINNYPNLPPDKQLSAPENDVAMMKDLLVKNYGFQNDTTHIKVLLSNQSTRKNIIEAFESQLIKNAEKNKGATVVFYYSGHGSQTPDQNDDEGDGEDETIVPTDSRDRDNRISDIVDDDIDEWFERLRLNTTNITFILDSCHSGTATKGIDSKLAIKEIPPDKRPQPKQKPLSASGKTRTKDISNGILPRNESYVTIAACLPEQKAQEDWFRTPEGLVPHGVLTHYLVQALQRKSDLTYRELEEALDSEIDRSFTQDAHVEGDIGRKVFGGAANREDPFVPLVAPASGKTLRIAAGAVHGVQVGTFLAIYKPEAKKLVGTESWLSNATVTEVTDFVAVAEMPTAVAIPNNAKVSIVTPNFGTKRLRVAVDPTGRAAFDPTGVIKSVDSRNAAWLIGVATRLSDSNFSRLVEVVRVDSGAPPPSGSWDVALVQTTFGEIKDRLSPTTTAMTPPANTETVYYLAQRDGTRPLFNVWVAPADTTGTDRITSALNKKARQDNLKRLYNASSPLNGKIKITVIRAPIETLPNGRAVVREQVRPEDQLGTCIFSLNETFRLRFDNTSDQELYITLLSLGTGGGINILSPGKRGVKISAHGNFTDGVPKPFKIFPPRGTETYKIIVTTLPTDFRFLEQEGARDLRDYTPLDLLMEQANTGRRKDTGQAADPGLENWTATQFSFEIK